jgi:putative DNA primase/helicase
MQERVRQLVGTTEGNLRIVTLDKQPGHEIPSLSTPLGQSLLEEVIQDTDVLVLDSISTLCNIATNDEENWLGLQNWIKRLRSKGLCIIFLHHAGKSGMQRGSSKSEDLLDISMKLSHPDDYDVADGLRCILEFDKVRGIVLTDGGPFEIKMTTENETAVWSFVEVEGLEFQKACEMFEEDESIRQIARILDQSPSKIQRWRQKWQREKTNQLQLKATA